MDWSEIGNQIFKVCIIPLLGLLTGYLIQFIKTKTAETKKVTKNDIAVNYINLLEQTVCDCIVATNQTYVQALKDKNAFDAEAQKEALQITLNAVKTILSDDAEEYLAMFVKDLDTYIVEKIEANIEKMKKK
jgi:hypothetical protein